MKQKLLSGGTGRTGRLLVAAGLLPALGAALLLTLQNADAANVARASSPSPTPVPSPAPLQPGHWDLNGGTLTMGGNLSGRFDAADNHITFVGAATPGKWLLEVGATGGGPASLDLHLSGPGPVMSLQLTVGGLPLTIGYAPSTGFAVSLGRSLPRGAVLGGARPVAAVAPSLAASGGDLNPVVSEIIDWARSTVAFTLVGLLLLLAIPQLRRTVVVRGRTFPLTSVGLGLILAVDIPLLALVLIGVGLPTGIWWLGVLLLLVYLVLMAAGLAFTGIEVGRIVFQRFGLGRFNAFVTTPVGVGLICLLGLIPYLGPVVMVASTIYGLGALFLWPRRKSAISLPPATSPAPEAGPIAARPSGAALE